MDGASIWAGDGVHLTSNAIRVAARKLMTDLVNGGEVGEPENKRVWGLRTYDSIGLI